MCVAEEKLSLQQFKAKDWAALILIEKGWVGKAPRSSHLPAKLM